MSALPPKADMDQHRRDVRFVPIGDKVQRSEMALLFDHLAGFDEQRRRHRQSECLRCLQIDQEIEFARLHNWQVGGLFAFEDAGDIGSGVLVALGDVGPIADQPSGNRIVAELIDRRQALLRGKANDAIEPRVEERSRGDEKRADALFYERR